MPGSIDCALVHSRIRADGDRHDDEDGDMTGMMITTTAKGDDNVEVVKETRNDKKEKG
jgi:hypothetical protein